MTTYRELFDRPLSYLSRQYFLRSFDGVVPPHFYGEMAKTALGCQTLHEKGHFPEFALFIRQHGHEKEDPELILKLKSILWTVVRGIFCGSVLSSILRREISVLPQMAFHS